MRTLKRDFFGWLASVVLAAYLKLEDWDSYEVDTLQAFHEFLAKARRDVGARLSKGDGR